MGSNTKRKTTMAKLNRERRLIERRQEKQARKDARKRASSEPDPTPVSDTPAGNDDSPPVSDTPAGNDG
jgi:hypothetical protein